MAQDHGFNFIALQVEPRNEQYAASLRVACNARNILCGIWEAFPFVGSASQFIPRYNAQFYIAQAERPEPWAEIVSNFRADYPNFPAAIVTNFGGIDTAESSKPLVDGNFFCLTEADLPSNPNATPDRLAFQAQQRGWTKSQPGFYLYGGKTLADYSRWFHMDGWWVWLAETMKTADWALL